MDQGNEARLRRVAHWQATVDEQENSGLSVREFCAERGLAPSQFYYWRRRLSAVGVEGLPGEADPEVGKTPAFVELDLGRPIAAQKPLPLEIRLDLGGGCTLSIRRG